MGRKIMVKKVAENLLKDGAVNSVVAQTFMKDYGIKEREFEIFLMSRKLGAEDVYRDIVEIFIEKGYNNVRCYLDWVRNEVEDIERYDEMPEEIKVSDIEKKKEMDSLLSRSIMYGILVWILVHIVIWILG
jgi:hypothetical protein